jgi:hypothetical protein
LEDREIDGIFKYKEKAEQFCNERNKELERSFKEMYGYKETTVVDPNTHRELSWLVHFELNKYRYKEYDLIE